MGNITAIHIYKHYTDAETIPNIEESLRKNSNLIDMKDESGATALDMVLRDFNYQAAQKIIDQGASYKSISDDTAVMTYIVHIISKDYTEASQIVKAKGLRLFKGCLIEYIKGLKQFFGIESNIDATEITEHKKDEDKSNVTVFDDENGFLTRILYFVENLVVTSLKIILYPALVAVGYSVMNPIQAASMFAGGAALSTGFVNLVSKHKKIDKLLEKLDNMLLKNRLAKKIGVEKIRTQIYKISNFLVKDNKIAREAEKWLKRHGGINKIVNIVKNIMPTLPQAMLILIAALVMTILVSIAKIKLDKDLEKIK